MRPPDPGEDPFVSFVLVVVAGAVAVSYLRGGRLSRLAGAPVRWNGLLLVGVALQVGVELLAGRGVIAAPGAFSWAGLLLSQLLVLGFIAANWQLKGMLLVAVGLMLNTLVIAANAAMPVDPAAIGALGLDGAGVPSGRHALLDADTRLPWLADRWALPPLRSVVSVGDVLLAAGLVPVTHELMNHRPAAERRSGPGSTR